MALRVWPTAVSTEVLNSDFEQCFRELCAEPRFFSVKLCVPLHVALRSVAWLFVLRCFALRVGLRVALRCVARRARNLHPESYKIRPRVSPRRRQKARNEPQEVAGDPT